MGPGLEELSDLLRKKFEEDEYEPRSSPEASAASVGSVASVGRDYEPHAYQTSVPTDLSLTLVGNEIAFDDLTSPGVQHGFRRLPYTCSLDINSLYPIVCAATRWYYHLRRRPAIPRRVLTGEEAGEGGRNVVMEVIELKGEDVERLIPAWTPAGVVKTSADDDGDMQTSLKKTISDGDVQIPHEGGGGRIGTAQAEDKPVYLEVKADGITTYGQRITNGSPYALYPALFYFDNSNFSISACICVSHSALNTDLAPSRSEILPSAVSHLHHSRSTITVERHHDLGLLYQ